MYDKLKKKIADNKEAIVGWGIIVAPFALYGLCIAVAVKQQRTYVEQKNAQQQALLDAFNEGKRILPVSDGSYLIFDAK